MKEDASLAAIYLLALGVTLISRQGSALGVLYLILADFARRLAAENPQTPAPGGPN